MRSQLRHYFQACAIKLLAAVDVDRLKSNQHEFNGAKAFRAILGEPVGKVPFPVRLLYLNDDAFDHIPEPLETVFTWYDARQNNPSRAPEYRLYYRQEADELLGRARSGDSLFLFRHPAQGSQPPVLTVAIARQGSTVLGMLNWLLNVAGDMNTPVSLTEVQRLPEREPVATESVLNILGITSDFGDDQLLESALKWLHSKNWPTAANLSSLARALTADQDVHVDPDGTILRWLGTELAIVRSLERYFLAERLQDLGWSVSLGSLSASMANEIFISNRRRQTWASESLREHISVLLQVRGVPSSSVTGSSRARGHELLFGIPSVCDRYSADDARSLSCKALFQDGLDMRGTFANDSFSTHVLTVQPSLCSDVTDALDARNMRLIVPRESHAPGYMASQQEKLLSVADFIEGQRQNQGG